jgi:23S rRNA pseudouridine1911/1915/1917 synthase
MINVKISKVNQDLNIKKYLESFHLAKSKIHNLFQQHKIMVNQEPINQDYILKVSDELQMDLSILNGNKIQPVDGPIDVVYEDQDILILNKPKFILVHTDGIHEDTLTNRVQFYRQNHPYQILPVHRLDFETSGVLIFGKHPLAQAFLSHQFEERLVEKIYIAKVEGIIKDDQGMINQPIARDRHHDKQRISQHGKPATSLYKVIKRFDDETLCQIKIIGGRKHQIRVHMASIGHPVIGDSLYGHLKKYNKGLELEFVECTLIHPIDRIKYTYKLKK